MSVLPWHHRWTILVLTMVSQALSLGISQFTFAFWVVPWLAEFQAPRSQIMLIITVSSIMMGVVSPFIGIALDRFPARRLYCAGTLLMGGGLVLVSLADSHWEILAIYALILPVGVSLIGQIGAQTLVTRWFIENRGLAIGISAVGVSIGAFVMPLVATALLAAGGWRFAFQVLAGLVVVLMLPFSWVVLSRRPDAVVQTSHKGNAPSQWTTAQLLRTRDFWLISGGIAGILFGVLPLMYGIGAYAHELGLEQSQAAFAAAFGAVTMAISKLGFGRLVDRLDHRVCFWIAGSLMITGMVIVSAANGFAALLVGSGLTTMGQGSVLPFLSATVASRFGVRSFGQVAGLATFVMSSGSLAPYFVGLIRDAGASYGSAFIAALIPIGIAMLAMRWLSKPSVT